MIEIINHGFYTSIQDMGRYDFQAFGVPISGALDQQAYCMANRILNNPHKAAVLEFSFKGPKIRFHKATHITLTGAKMKAKLNEVEINYYIPIRVYEGDVLDLGTVKNGCRTYLGISGGIKTKKILKSRSQFKDLTSDFRIYKKVLLPIGKSNFNPKKGVHLYQPNQNYSQKVLKVYPGPEFNQLTKTQQNQIFITTFSISKLNNRMAFSFEEKIANKLPQIWTAPVIPGTVQCSPDGSLIVLMRDAQVTGGYPRILQLNYESINLLAQKTTRDQLRFKLLPKIE